MNTSTKLFILCGFSLAVWAVSLAGIASVQNSCVDSAASTAVLSGIQNFSAGILTCGQLYRFWWFVVIYEFVVVFGLIIATAVKSVRSQSASWLGLLSVATLLYVQAIEAFLTAQDVSIVNTNGILTSRARTMTAGCVMVCVMNCFTIIFLGTEREDETAEKQPSVKADVI